jgi:hypothetical protein
MPSRASRALCRAPAAVSIPAASLEDVLGPYQGYVLGFLALAAVLLLNQLIFRRRWRSYPTRDEYLAAHPDCDTAGGVTCSRCGRKALGGGVIGAGRIYRCGWCEIELYRVDRTA